MKNGDGEKSWGHAGSTDLIHWEQLPHAILPYKSGSGKGGAIWSGSAVVDHNNSLGKQAGDIKTIVAFFTHTANPMEQCAAYSIDRGRTFRLINQGDAVVPNQGLWRGERDPKVFWHEPTGKWVMAVIVIYDRSPGYWGLVLVDNIVQSDRKVGYEQVTKEIKITKKLLLFPIAKSGSAA